MKIELALYDPSQPADDSSFWSWRSPSLSRKLLDHLYYDVMVTNKPDDPNSLRLNDIVGGVASFDSEWGFIYRFFDGGRDALGRPGRFVAIVAGFRLSESRISELSGILTSHVFRSIGELAPRTCPLPPPDRLEIEIETSECDWPKDYNSSDTKLKKHTDAEFACDNAFEKGMHHFASLPDSGLRIGLFSEANGNRFVKILAPKTTHINPTPIDRTLVTSSIKPISRQPRGSMSRPPAYSALNSKSYRRFCFFIIFVSVLVASFRLINQLPVRNGSNGSITEIELNEHSSNPNGGVDINFPKMPEKNHDREERNLNNKHKKKTDSQKDSNVEQLSSSNDSTNSTNSRANLPNTNHSNQLFQVVNNAVNFNNKRLVLLPVAFCLILLSILLFRFSYTHSQDRDLTKKPKQSGNKSDRR